ncbi:Ig-like domain-containing protein, partial [Rothia nasisuis]
MSQRFRRLMLVRSILAILITLGVAVPSINIATAQEQDSSVTISNITAKADSVTGAGNVNIYSLGTLSFDWSAPNGVTAGQTFSLELPAEFNGTAQKFELKDEQGTVGADCTVASISGATKSRVTCVFNGNFAGKDNVKGSVNVRVSFSNTSQTNQFPITVTVDGTPTVETVTLTGPKGEGVGKIAVPYQPMYKQSAKNGWLSLDNTNRTFGWQIYIGSDYLRNNNLIGSTAPITIVDTLEGPHEFNASRVNVRGLLTELDDYRVETSVKTDYQISADKKSMTITLYAPDGGWTVDRNISVTYRTQYSGEGPIPFDVPVSNKATGLEKNVSTTVVRRDGASGTIQGVDRGSFALTKRVAGDAVGKVPAGQEFEVAVTIDVSKSVNPNFAFPNTMKVPGAVKNGTSVTYTQTVKKDQQIRGFDSLPQGSIVTLSEPTLPPVPDVRFGDPVFSGTGATISEDGKTATIQISSETTANSQITLTNTAQEIPPTPSESPT